MNKTINEHIRNHILKQKGLLETSVDYNDLKKSEWSDIFEQLMRNRLIFGAYRYGKLNTFNKKKYNNIEAIGKRLQGYIKTGNLEHLVDIANLCLLEFEEGTHPKKHFKSVDDGEHVKST